METNIKIQHTERLKRDLQEELSSMIQANQRFRLNCSEEQATDWLKMCYMYEVAKNKWSENLSEVKIGDKQMEIIEAVAKWITDKESKPWLLIIGYIGTGKSTMLKAIKTLIQKLYGDKGQFAERLCVVNASDFTDKENMESGRTEEMAGSRLLAVDDLGTEPVAVNSWGNVEAPIVDMIYSRYDRRRFTIIATNLLPKELEERYKGRAYDRMREMAEVVTIEGSSMRGRIETL